MKQGWKIKKIGDVVQKIFAGGDKPHMFSEQQTDICCVPVYGNGVTNDGLCGYTDHYVVNERCLTVSARGTVGYCCVRNEPFVPIVRLITIIPQESIGVEFLCYALSTIDIENNGVAIPQLTVPMIKNVSIPVPPIAEQEKIVAELDCLSGIIEKKKQQLKELDNLAQSIFYEMFGNPLRNERGWGLKRIADVCVVNPPKKVTAQGLGNKDVVSFLPMEDLPIKACYHQPDKTQLYEEVQSSYTCFANDDVLMAKVTPCFENGKLGIATNLHNGVGYGSSEFIVIRANNVDVLKEYIYFVTMDSLFIEKACAQLTGTSGLRRVPRQYVENCNITLPPLTLQQQFASKIESIEKQKELITQSIKETETLFNSRMDYYFN